MPVYVQCLLPSTQGAVTSHVCITGAQVVVYALRSGAIIGEKYDFAQSQQSPLYGSLLYTMEWIQSRTAIDYVLTAPTEFDFQNHVEFVNQKLCRKVRR